MSELISVILNGIIMILLAGTMYYCARLSMHIKAFRQSRAEMEKLLADLSGNIERADRAIEGLRQGAREAGRDLQERIGEARALSEELQIISDSCERLAGRMEQVIERGRTVAPAPSFPAMTDKPARKPASAATARLPEEIEERSPLAGFAIRDREMEDDFDEDAIGEDGLLPGEDDEDEAGDGFSSRAERELYEALRRKKTDAGSLS